MSLPRNTSQLDPATGYQIPVNSGTWANLSTWSSWAGWKNQPGTSMTVVSNVIDRNTTGWFNIKTDTEVVGNIAYSVYTSNTGAFGGEESVTNIEPNTSNISAFYGRYFAVVANVSSSSGQAQLRRMNITNSNNRFDLHFNDIDSTNLDGTNSSRVLPIGRTVGAVVNMQVSSQDLVANFSDYFDTTTPYVLPYYSATSTITSAPITLSRSFTQYMAVSRNESTYLDLYKTTNGSSWSLVTSGNIGAGSTYNWESKFSQSGGYVAYAGNGVRVFTRSGDTLSQLYYSTAINNATNIAWGQVDDTWFASGHGVSPYIGIYKYSGGTWVKQSNPGSIPSAEVLAMAWDPTDTYLACAIGGSPYIEIYKRSGDTFTKLSNPGTLPSTACVSVAWDPSGTYLIAGTSVVSGSANLVVYYRSGDSFIKLTDPTLPTVKSSFTDIKYNPSGNAFAVSWAGSISSGTDSRFFGVYRQSGNAITWMDTTNSVNLGEGTQGTSVDWLSDGTQLYVSYYRSASAGNPGVAVYGVDYSNVSAISLQSVDAFTGNLGKVECVSSWTSAYETIIEVASVAGFPSSGNIRVADETMSYTGANSSVTPNRFENIVRGVSTSQFGNSTPSVHPAGVEVYPVGSIDFTARYTSSETAPTPIPYIASKDRVAPAVTFRDTNGSYTSSVFDAVVWVLPEQYMDNTNINFR